jgi:excisionase family DNA binding protein
MDFNYISTKEAAKMLGVTERYVQMLCKEGKIEGAMKFNDQGVWLVPKESILLKQTIDNNK